MDCYFYDVNGSIVMPSKTNDELNFNNYEFYCLINDKIRYNDDNRKVIHAINKDYLIKRIAIFMQLQKEGIKYIIKKSGQTETKIFFRSKNIVFIILRMFIVKYYINILSRKTMTYILMKIKGIPDNYIRGRFIRQYIQHPSKKYDKIFRQIDKATDLSSSERYGYKYNYIANSENGFAEFDGQYQKIVKKGDATLKQILQNKKFESYYKSFDYPVFDYKFHISYVARDKITDDLLKEISKLEKKIGVEIVYD